MPKGDYIRKTARYNGKQYEAYGKTELEAITKLADKLTAVKRGEGTIGGSMTVDAWFSQWIATYKEPKGLTQKSLGMYREKYTKYIKPRIGRLKLKDVKDIHLQKILNEQAGMSSSHAQKVRQVLQGMFKRARQSRLIPYDPSELLELPATTTGTHRSITDAERAAILEVSKTSRAGLWVLTMLYTGMRPGETAALTWADVDFKNNEIHVHAAAESGTGAIKGPKTAAGVRDILYIQNSVLYSWRPEGSRSALFFLHSGVTSRTAEVSGVCGLVFAGTWIFIWGRRCTAIRSSGRWWRLI